MLPSFSQMGSFGNTAWRSCTSRRDLAAPKHLYVMVFPDAPTATSRARLSVIYSGRMNTLWRGLGPFYFALAAGDRRKPPRAQANLRTAAHLWLLELVGEFFVEYGFLYRRF
jgi:hypothetical protein